MEVQSYLKSFNIDLWFDDDATGRIVFVDDHNIYSFKNSNGETYGKAVVRAFKTPSLANCRIAENGRISINYNLFYKTDLEKMLVDFLNETQCKIASWNSDKITGVEINLQNFDPHALYCTVVSAFMKNSAALGKFGMLLDLKSVNSIPTIHKLMQASPSK